MANTIGYVRTSGAGQNPQLQLDALHAAGAARIFTETASGAQANRPQLTAALEYLNPGDCLAVWRIDRLARSTLDAVTILGQLQERDIEFRSLTEAIDTTSPGGRMVCSMMAAMATMEREIIIQRTKAGLESAKAKGRVGGRPSVITEDRKALARSERKKGRSQQEIADALGVSRATVGRMLTPTAAAQRLIPRGDCG